MSDADIYSIWPKLLCQNECPTECALNTLLRQGDVVIKTLISEPSLTCGLTDLQIEATIAGMLTSYVTELCNGEDSIMYAQRSASSLVQGLQAIFELPEM